MGSGWGVEATVLVPTEGGLDRLGNPVPDKPERVVVPGVLVAPGATGATVGLEASRPEDVRVALTLHFPKSFKRSLRGCTVTLPEPWGGPWRVIGDPMPYDDALCPGPWHMPVEVARVDG